MTTQKLNQILTKAMPKSKLLKSAKVKGWGTWTSGYLLERGWDDEYIIRVSYSHFKTISSGTKITDLNKLAAALAEAQVTFTQDNANFKLVVAKGA